jgi:hypothetical protein
VDDDNDDEEEEIDTRSSVLASTRCTFTVPLHRPELSGYRRCFRSNRRLGGNKISWIYLHGVELEKKGPSGKWIKHWICRYCHEQGRIKVMNAQASTTCTRHLHDQHGIGLERLEESVQAQGRIEGFMDEHLWEERWREDYVNWARKMTSLCPKLRALTCKDYSLVVALKLPIFYRSVVVCAAG